MGPLEPQVFPANSLKRVPCKPPRGKPDPELRWEKGGERVPTEGRVYQDGQDLVFSPIEEEDSGTYTCVAQNKAGQRTQELTITVASKFSSRRFIGGAAIFSV